MKIRNILAKFTCGLLVTTMIFSLVACGEKDSNDDDDDDKKDEKKVEVSVDDLMKDMEKNSEISTEMIDKALEDDCFTYEEFEDIMKSISSFKAEGKIDFALSMEAEDDGEKTDENLAMDASFVMEYDNKNLGFHFGLEMNMESSEDKNENKLDFWLVNEDDVFYMYQKETDDDVAYRTEVGNLKEAFGEGITKDQLEELFEGLEDVEGIGNMSDLSDSLADYAESDTIKGLEKHFSVDDEYVKYNGKDHYNLVYKFSANKIIDILLKDEDVKNLLEEMEIEDVDSILSSEIATDITVQDIIDVVDFDINFYVDTKDYFIAHMDIDLKDALNNGLNLFEGYLLEMAKEQDAVNPSIDLECSAASFTYDFDNDADVTVKFKGEYEDVTEDDDWYGDYTDSDLVVNGNTFDILSYSDEKLMTVTIPEGFKIDSEYSSSHYVYLEDDNYNTIDVDSDAYYWIQDFINGEEYEPDLDFYTRDELTLGNSIKTNQGTVTVVVNTYSFDEDYENEYYVDYTLVLVKGENYPSIEVSADILEEYDVTLEDFAKSLLQ